MPNVFVKLTASLSIAGVIKEIGHILEVTEEEAKALLHRGVAEVATEADTLKAADVKPATKTK